ncbi:MULTISPECIES: hypothetical protein [Streptomycetaceae]|uniref:hypothetical protein n=1 Tax=Streptomycetaceae TaxID=2062 RepID=UPI000CDC6ADE|nr:MULTISPECIES: hypothetical protein [Streptomycetaceae]AUY48063.1 hypothetical protein C2142_02740 [Streptomyces sp. CB01881]MBP0449432.1 hypothetical protein [Kitasatospora sp. RG8]TYC76547.1 hypothetical protein EH183_02750 [Streptomyces sp. CB01881]
MFAHWGTFTKNDTLGDCLGLAQAAVESQGFQVWDLAGDGDYQVIGGNNDVITTIVCVPQAGNTWLTVSAYSTDSTLAERTRNDVRSYIVNSIRID